MYEHVIKRILDIVVSFIALILLLPLLIVMTLVGAVKMKGNPFFVQPRPGLRRKNRDGSWGQEKIFNLIKFRSMTCETDDNGRLLPDDQRLTKYGEKIRATSLDELPELLNVLVGDMSIVGPRPLLVRDMVFMSDEERNRHNVRQGITGLAQINGRNCILWENKLKYDLKYLENISFWSDVSIILKTVKLVLVKDGVSSEGMATAEDFGDYLLREGKINSAFYYEKQDEAKKLLTEYSNE